MLGVGLPALVITIPDEAVLTDVELLGITKVCGCGDWEGVCFDILFED